MYSLKDQPKQFVPEADKNAQWFMDNIRYVAEKYNTQQNQLGYRTPQQLDKPVDEMIRLFTYYLGKQENRDYAYAMMDAENCKLPHVWINGQKLTSMVDFMLGNAIKMIENIEPTVRGTSKVLISKKNQMYEMGLAKIQLKEIVDLMSQKGVEFTPTGMEDFETPEDLKKYMMYDYKEYSEEIAQRLAQDILFRNKFIEKYKQAFLYLLLGGVIGIENYVKQGRQLKEVILPYNLIWDNTVDDDYNSRAQFVGKVDWLTPGEILSNPDYIPYLSPENIQEIQTVNTQTIDKMLGEEYITSNQLRWWYNFNGVPKMACVTGYWVGYKQLKYERTKDQYGNEHFSKSRKAKSPYWVKTVYKGTLIANKYIVDYGETNNIVRNFDDKNEVELPITVFLPNMVMGETRSIASRLHKHQDRIDYLTYQITKAVDRAKGKVFILNKHKLGSATSQEVLNDFETMGIHITDGNATGEDPNMLDGNRVVEPVDMTLDPNVRELINLKMEEERIMEEIVNVPKIAMGQQQGYLGAKTQAGSIAQSNLGTAYLYQGFIRFIEKDLQYALNQYKISLLDVEEDGVGLVDDQGYEFLRITDDVKFEDFGVYIKVKDFLDEQAKERLLSIAQAAMQNQLIDMRDYIKIETSKSYTELLKELEYAMAKKDMEKKEEMRRQQIMQAAQQEAMMQAQMEQARIAQEGSSYRQELKTAADVVKSAPPVEQGIPEGPGPEEAAADAANAEAARMAPEGRTIEGGTPGEMPVM
jgi:hypothetical protein